MNNLTNKVKIFCFVMCGSLPNFVSSADSSNSRSLVELESRAQSLKQEMIDLGAEMQLIENELLYPYETRLEVFLSMDVGQFFSIESIELSIDGKNRFEQKYFSIESDSFKKGSVQRLFLGNIEPGKHELKIFFIGRGPRDRNYKRGLVHVFEKKSQATFIEVRIQDDERQLQPDFFVKEWKV